jgi:hypothetical protein
VIFGEAEMITDDDARLAALRIVSEQLVPGQWDATRGPNRKELAATAVLALPLAEASVKVRTGPPGDEPEDYETGVWAGVVPARLEFGAPQDDPLLRAGISVPAHVAALSERFRAG